MVVERDGEEEGREECVVSFIERPKRSRQGGIQRRWKVSPRLGREERERCREGGREEGRREVRGKEGRRSEVGV